MKELLRADFAKLPALLAAGPPEQPGAAAERAPAPAADAPAHVQPGLFD